MDRDATPELPRRFHVSAYPSLLVLGPDAENIHRFSGFKKPPEFLTELRDALSRWRLFQAGKAFDHPPARPKTVTDLGQVHTWPAPSDAVPCGLARLGKELWLGQGHTLFALDAESGRVRRSFDLQSPFQDIASDGVHLYVVTARWTQGAPILVLDPDTGKVLRKILTQANQGKQPSTARGICYHAGKLYVSEIFGKVHELDPKTGDVERTLDSGLHWVFGLAFDGKHFVTGGRKALHLLDPQSMHPVRSVPTHYRLRAVGFDAGEYLLMEQPIFGFDRHHDPVRVFPRRTVLHRLTLPLRDPEAGARRRRSP